MSLTNNTIIVVLGNRLESYKIHEELKGRMDTAISLYNSLLTHLKNTDTVLLLTSGGISNLDVPISEAELMKEYCIKHKINKNCVITETNSLDTIGNAFFTRKIIDTISNVSDVYIISSCYHMNRTKYIFYECYGKDKYDLIFDYCFFYEKPNVSEKEEKSLNQSRAFFNTINPGDIGAIEKKLFTAHRLYTI